MTAAEYRRKLNLPPAGEVGTTVAPKAQIRLPAPVTMNKTERTWLDHLQRQHPAALVAYEPFTLRLPSGTRYTPDAVVIDRATGRVHEIWEVKGAHIHNSASIRAFKEARAAFPFWTFSFAQKTKDGWATA